MSFHDSAPLILVNRRSSPAVIGGSTLHKKDRWLLEDSKRKNEACDSRFDSDERLAAVDERNPSLIVSYSGTGIPSPSFFLPTTITSACLRQCACPIRNVKQSRTAGSTAGNVLPDSQVIYKLWLMRDKRFVSLSYQTPCDPLDGLPIVLRRRFRWGRLMLCRISVPSLSESFVVLHHYPAYGAHIDPILHYR